jgi:hypothetical protein
MFPTYPLIQAREEKLEAKHTFWKSHSKESDDDWCSHG